MLPSVRKQSIGCDINYVCFIKLLCDSYTTLSVLGRLNTAGLWVVVLDRQRKGVASFTSGVSWWSRQHDHQWIISPVCVSALSSLQGTVVPYV